MIPSTGAYLKDATENVMGEFEVPAVEVLETSVLALKKGEGKMLSQ